jgi:hypothetical protein
VFADNLGHVRHLVVAPDNTLYTNTWSGRYFPNSPPPLGGFLLGLRDTKGTGRADAVERFGVTVEEGGTGGSGIALYRESLFAEENGRILRYQLHAGSPLPTGKPLVVVSGLPLTEDHPMHPFVIDQAGSLFVDLGSATNACQEENRIPGSHGIAPCIEKETRAGTWRFDANKTDQIFSPTSRYASGIRNGEGFAFDAEGRLFVMQHGRDQLFQNWPRLYTPEQSAELPAEELLLLVKGADYGWPECYYDQQQGKLVLAPEYGGDGGKAVGECAPRHGEYPRKHLSGWAGVMQADAFAGYNELYDARRQPGPIYEAACWAHARRKFFDLAKSTKAPIAIEAVRRIDELFEIERSSRRKAKSPRRSITLSIAGPPSRAFSTMDAFASQTTPPNAPCAAWLSAEKIGHSPEATKAGAERQPSIRSLKLVSSTMSIRRRGLLTCWRNCQIIQPIKSMSYCLGVAKPLNRRLLNQRPRPSPLEAPTELFRITLRCRPEAYR